MNWKKNVMIPKTLEDYCADRDRALEMYGQAERIVSTVREDLHSVGDYIFPLEAAPMSLDKFRENIDRRLWRLAFDKTGFLKVMDAQALSKFQNDIESRAPEFTVDNIQATFLTLYQEKDEMFARGLVNVFRGLAGYYRTHDDQSFKVGRKFILEWTIETPWSSSWTPRIRYEKSATINDIDRVFKILDDQPHVERSLETAMNGAWSEWEDAGSVGQATFEDDYYRAKAFKNGNLHLEFKRPDLVDKANLVIADYYDGRALAKAA